MKKAFLLYLLKNTCRCSCLSHGSGDLLCLFSRWLVLPTAFTTMQYIYVHNRVSLSCRPPYKLTNMPRFCYHHYRLNSSVLSSWGKFNERAIIDTPRECKKQPYLKLISSSLLDSILLRAGFSLILRNYCYCFCCLHRKLKSVDVGQYRYCPIHRACLKHWTYRILHDAVGPATSLRE